MKVPVGEVDTKSNIQVKLRLDYRGETQARFFFGGKNGVRAAEEIREQKAALLKNVPFQGILLEDIDSTLEVYSVYDEATGEEIAYAPLILTLWADSVEDLMRFVIKDEFRKIDIVQPTDFTISGQELERILFKINEEMNNYRATLEKKFSRK
ncbi:MAG TPA: hypothetical protein GX711_02075 [Clostridia bacterium]|nr:hypothetical protein [Clostridia bacterium]